MKRGLRVMGGLRGLASRRWRRRLRGAVVVRPSVVFGAGDQFVRRFAALLAVAGAMPLIGGGQTTFQPVFVGDLTRAFLRLASMGENEFEKFRGEALEFGGAQNISLKELYQEILHATGQKCWLFPMSFRMAQFMALPMEFLPAPPLTTDQVTLLKSDNLVSPERDGFAKLGMQPDPLSFHLPSLVAPYAKPYARLRAARSS